MPVPGRRVLVTRASHQASALGDALAARGLTVVAVPTIALEDPLDGYAALDAAIADLDAYDWILFTSANAVAAFRQRCEQAECEDIPCRVASIGAATSRAIRAAGMEVDLEAPVAVAESLASALRARAAGVRMLLVRAEQGRDVLVQVLTAAGADVEMVAAYRTVIPEGSVEALRRELPRVNAITCTSSSSVRNLLELCDAAGLTIPPGIVLASIGPITSQTLRASGYEPAVEAKVADVEVLASELARYLERL